jgi:protein-S-isoprenylcysteine O-methyltransferase Ste14
MDKGGSLFGYEPSGHAQVSSRFGPIVRFGPSIICLLLPVCFFFFIFRPVVRTLVRHEFATAAPLPITSAMMPPNCPIAEGQVSPDLVAAPLVARALDLSGRYDFTIPSAIIVFLALIAIGFSFIVMARRSRFPLTLYLWIVSAVLGAAIFFVLRHDEGTREIIVRTITDAAAAANVVPKSLENVILHTVQWNVGTGVSATVVILIALAVISVRAKDEELIGPALRQRLFDLKALMVIVAGILVLTVLITRALIGWQINFLCQPERDALAPLAASLADYWGASSTGVMIAAFLPAFFAWSHDVAHFGEKILPDGTDAERKERLVTEGLVFAPTTSLTALLTIAAPALASPILNLVGSLYPG